MDNTKFHEILESKTTPMYVFHIEELERRIGFLRQHLPAHVELCYAVKANAFITKEVAPLVERLEICSPGELQICQSLNLPTDKFVISGVHKDPEQILEAISQSTEGEIFTVESEFQFSILQEAARSCKKHITLLLRLTSGNQFGLDEEALEKLISHCRENPWIEIRGIQYFSGTQKSSLKRLKREITFLDEYLQKLSEAYGYQAAELEFGPGLPFSYFQGENFNEEALLNEFSELLSGMKFQGKIILELGRSIAASCGYYLTKVVDTKHNHGQNYAIVDGGMHQLAYYGQFMAMKHPFMRLLPHDRKAEQNEKEEWNICGSLCTVNDILVKQVPLGKLQLGDVLAFENTGAYSMTEGISLFLSRDLPEIVLLKRDGSLLTVREHTWIDNLNTPNYKIKK